MKGKNNKVKIDFVTIIVSGVISLIVGIITSLFSFWLTKTFGYSFF